MVAPAGQHLDGDYEGAGSEHIVFRAGGCEPCAAPGDPLGPAADFADSRRCGEAAAQRQTVDRGGEYRNGTDPELVHAATGGRGAYVRDPGQVLPRAEREERLARPGHSVPRICRALKPQEVPEAGFGRG